MKLRKVIDYRSETHSSKRASQIQCVVAVQCVVAGL